MDKRKTYTWFLLFPLLTIFVCYNLAYCKNTNHLSLKNKILSLLSKRPIPNSIDSVIDESDKLSEGEKIRLYIELLDYSIDGITGEQLSEKTTRLQENILPFLVEKLNSPLECIKEYKNICSNEEERYTRAIRMIEAIKKGIVLYCEYPPGLYSEAEKTLNILKIFISDYKKNKGILPQDLYILRNYVFEKYGYKLVIHDPFSDEIKYTVLNKVNYKIELIDDFFKRNQYK